MNEPITTAVKPLRNLVYVEKIRRTRTGGGVLLPQFGAFCGHSAKKKMAATPDYFPARVLSIGPDVKEIKPGDEVLVYTFAEGDGSKLYTGENVGERERLMVMYPNDVLCVVEYDPEPEEEDASGLGDGAGNGTPLAPPG